MKKIHATILTTLLLCGCMPRDDLRCHSQMDFACENSNLRGLKGKIINGYYQHPYGSYSIKLPEMMSGARIDEHLLTPTRSTIVFFDDFGNLVRVEVAIQSREEMEALDFLFTENYEKEFHGLFEYCALAPIASMFKGTRLLEEKTVEIEGIGKTYFALIEIPNGSNMKNLDTGKFDTSTRAYMMSFAGSHLVTLSVQESTLSKNAREFYKITGHAIPPVKSQELYDTLIELRKTYNQNENSDCQGK